MAALFWFLVWPSKFVQLAARYDLGINLSGDSDLAKKFDEGSYDGDPLGTEQLARERTWRLRSGMGLSLLLVGGSAGWAIAGGLTLTHFVGAPRPVVSMVLQMGAAALLLWATIWELNWGIRSFSGETLPERVHGWIFKGLYIVGTWCLFLSLVWR